MCRFAAVLLVLPIALFSSVAFSVRSATAQTWTGNSNGNWNNANNWTPIGIPTSSINTQLTFGGSANTSMNDDLPSPFLLNRLNFSSLGPAYTLSGNALQFNSNGSGLVPWIIVDNVGGITINNPLSGNFQAVGIGNLALNGLISGSSGFTNWIEGGIATIGNNSNSFTGPVTIGAIGGAGVNATLAISTITNGGIISPLGASSSAPANLTLQGNGTLLLTGTNPTYSTDRGIYVSNSSGAGVNVQNAGTTLTWNGQITNGSEFHKRGTGTLILTNPTNNYSGTTVDEGTLIVGNASAIPGNITVRTGAVFDTNGFANPGKSPQITVQGGTFRHASSVNSLNTFGLGSSSSGGTFDLTGSSNVGFNVGFLSFKGNTALNGPGSNYINNSSVGTLQFNIDPGVTVTSGLSLAALASPVTHPFKLVGGGTLYLTNPAAYQALVTVNQGTLRMDSLADVGPGGFEITIDGGTYKYSGPTNSAGGIALGPGGGTLEVTSAATIMTLTGPITGSPATLTKTGTGTLALTSGVSTFGDLAVAAGTVQTANDATLGTGSVNLSPLTTLRYTSSTSSSRTFNLLLGAMSVDSGATLTLNGAAVNGGVIRGSGHIAIAGGTTLASATTVTSLTIDQIGSATAANLTNGGAYNVNTGQTLALNLGTNTSAGRLTVNGTANVSDFVSNGQINIPTGGALNNSGSSLVLGGGSRTFVGSVASAGGTLDLGGQTLELNGGLLVNNGTVNGTVNVNYGSLAKGTGAYGIVNVTSGGVYSPGNSPGISNAAAVSFDNAPAASGLPALAIEIAGTTPGTQYDQLHVSGQLSLGGALQVALLDFSPSAGQRFDILDWGSITGTFASLGLPALSSGLSWNTTELYTRGVLSVQAGLPGDYNQNGAVDAADYVVWRKSGGTSTSYATWQSNYGNSFGSGTGVGASATIPEPATLWMLLISIAMISTRPRSAKPARRQ